MWDAMIEMYERYGYYKDAIQSITLKGIEGLAKIQEILETLRKNPPAEIAGYKVLKARDYQERHGSGYGDRRSYHNRSAEFQCSVL